MIGYTFRDKAGRTWHQVTKTTARRAYEAGQAVTICAANLRPGFPWYPEAQITKDHMEEINAGPVPFDRITNQYEALNCVNTETGKYARYYMLTAPEIIIYGGFDGKREREALRCDTWEEAVKRLNKAMTRIDANLWRDAHGQEFSITEA